MSRAKVDRTDEAAGHNIIVKSTISLPPLKYKLFRALWIASLIANIGFWMQNVGSAWLMTSLTTSPVMVALTQTAISLPAFFFGLPLQHQALES